MRWASLLIFLALLCALVIVLRGAVVRDGLSLLALALAAAALLAVWISRRASREQRR